MLKIAFVSLLQISSAVCLQNIWIAIQSEKLLQELKGWTFLDIVQLLTSNIERHNETFFFGPDLPCKSKMGMLYSFFFPDSNFISEIRILL